MTKDDTGKIGRGPDHCDFECYHQALGNHADMGIFSAEEYCGEVLWGRTISHMDSRFLWLSAKKGTSKVERR